MSDAAPIGAFFPTFRASLLFSLVSLRFSLLQGLGLLGSKRTGAVRGEVCASTTRSTVRSTRKREKLRDARIIIENNARSRPSLCGSGSEGPAGKNVSISKPSTPAVDPLSSAHLSLPSNEYPTSHFNN